MNYKHRTREPSSNRINSKKGDLNRKSFHGNKSFQSIERTESQKQKDSYKTTNILPILTPKESNKKFIFTPKGRSKLHNQPSYPSFFNPTDKTAVFIENLKEPNKQPTKINDNIFKPIPKIVEKTKDENNPIKNYYCRRDLGEIEVSFRLERATIGTSNFKGDTNKFQLISDFLE